MSVSGGAGIEVVGGRVESSVSYELHDIDTKRDANERMATAIGRHRSRRRLGVWAVKVP